MAATLEWRDWRRRLKADEDLEATATGVCALSRAAFSAKAAAILLLDVTGEKLYVAAADPAGNSYRSSDQATIGYGRADDPLTLCLREARTVFHNNYDTGQAPESVDLLRRLFGRAFSGVALMPLSSLSGRTLGAIAVLDAAHGEKLEIAPDFIADYGASLIEARIKDSRWRIQTQEMLADMERLNLSGGFRQLPQKMVGRSEAIKKVQKLLAQAAEYRSTVLLTGETGSGKELAAEALHWLSHKGQDAPFVKINCAAIPAQLLESELFGHAQGAFTGAAGAKKGLLREADGGTVLLDEIGEMSLETQAKILRFLQDRLVRPVGDLTGRPVDVMVVAATNRDLTQDRAKKLFRNDLYHRLAVCPIQMPSLRERREDIPLLAAHFLEEFGRRRQLPSLTLTAEAAQYLRQRDYDGNIRELFSLLERAVITNQPGSREIGIERFADDDKLRVKDLALPEKLALLEQSLVAEAVASCKGNISQASKKLGVPRTTLYSKVHKIGSALGPYGE